MSNRISFSVVSGAANIKLPAFAIDDGVTSDADLVATAIARKNNAGAQSVHSVGRAGNTTRYSARIVRGDYAIATVEFEVA